MSVWNAVLQASHSALIDILNEIFPDDKLELGLPKRFNSWNTLEGADAYLFRELKSGNESGILALGFRSKDLKAAEKIFNLMIALTKKEFNLRSIDAVIGNKLEATPTLQMTIWLPIKIANKSDASVFNLAVGI